MDLRLSNSELDLRARARDFVETYLYPVELEENGKLSEESHARIKQAILDYRLNAFSTPEEFGGQIKKRGTSVYTGWG